MDLQTALAVFTELEAHCYDADGIMEGDEPLFDVRLDAGTDRNEKRTCRVRVTTGAIERVSWRTWQTVLDAARPHDLTVDVQNAGLELH